MFVASKVTATWRQTLSAGRTGDFWAAPGAPPQTPNWVRPVESISQWCAPAPSLPSRAIQARPAAGHAVILIHIAIVWAVLPAAIPVTAARLTPSSTPSKLRLWGFVKFSAGRSVDGVGVPA